MTTEPRGDVLELVKLELTVARVAGILGVSDKTVLRFVKRGALPCYRIGRQLKFSRRDVADFMRAQRIDRQG